MCDLASDLQCIASPFDCFGPLGELKTPVVVTAEKRCWVVGQQEWASGRAVVG